uniref:ATP synthase F0 subunit 8 n=1 Tax=Aspidodiadema arcitum TaxID=2962504 RepID=UPI00211444AF|nr:ATP synthase F0 subunit 8 [Aspidodiadema arcitum]UTD49252.1 ATP synthase F0 subunit 8 [Aspidodiadema arcitum]
MPQLDFTWWIVNFFIIWIAVILTFIIITANSTSPNVNPNSSAPNVNKQTTNWQWF